MRAVRILVHVLNLLYCQPICAAPKSGQLTITKMSLGLEHADTSSSPKGFGVQGALTGTVGGPLPVCSSDMLLLHTLGPWETYLQ